MRRYAALLTIALIVTVTMLMAVPRSTRAATSYVDSTEGGGTGTALSCTKPSGTASGDRIIAVINSNGPRTITDNNTGFDFTSEYTASYNGPSAGIIILSHLAGGSEPATYDFTGSVSDRWTLHCYAIRGADTSTVFDVTPAVGTQATGSGATQTSGSITTSTNGAFIIAVRLMDSNTVTTTGTPADSFTDGEDTGNQLMSTSYKVQSSAGTQNAVSWTSSGGTGWLTQIFAVKAASAGGPTNESPKVPVFIIEEE